MAAGNHGLEFEVGVVTTGGAAFQAVVLLQVQLAVTTIGRAGGKLAAQIGEQLARAAGKAGGLLQDAGVAGVADDKAALFLAGLEHQLAIDAGEFALHPAQARRGMRGGWRKHLAAGGEQRQGENHQGTGNTHRGVSWQVPPRYSGQESCTSLAGIQPT